MSRAIHTVAGSKKRLTAFFGVIALALLTAMVAVAYFTTHGSGTSSASIGTLGSPAPVTASSAAHVHWAAVAAPSGTSSDVTYTVSRNGGSGFVAAAGSCAGSLSQSTVSCDDSVPASGSYAYQVTAHFRSWTSSATSASVAVDTTAPTSTITFPLAGAKYNAAGWNAGCSSSICGTAVDEAGGSGLGNVKISIHGPGGYWNGSNFTESTEQKFTAAGTSTWALAFAATNFTTPGGGDGSYTVNSYATDNDGNTQSPATSKIFTIDNIAPTALSINASDTSSTSASAVHWAVTFSESVTGVDATDFALAGAGATGASVTGVSGSGTSYSVTVSTGNDGSLGLNLADNDSIQDAAGNKLGGTGAGNGNFTGQTYLIDKTAPTISREVVADSTVNTGGFVKQGGGYFVYAQLSDAGSGIASVIANLSAVTTGANFVALTTSGGPWTVNAQSYNYRSTLQTANNPLNEISNPYAFSVSAADNAANSSNANSSVNADNTGPTGGSVDASGLVGTGSRYSTSTNLSIAFTAGTDSGVGIASSSGFVLKRASATLTSVSGTSNGTCGSFSSFAQVGSTGLGSPFADNAADGISTGRCYRYQYVVTDQLGNQTVYTSGDIKVDTSAPSAPTPTLSAATGNTFVNGTTAFINAQAGKSGGFTVTSSPTDTDSGILNVIFPTPAGFTSGGATVTSSPYSTTYAWSGAVGATGSQAITATNDAMLTNTASFAVTSDTTAPSGGSATITGLGGTGSLYSTSTTLSITLAKGTDTGSGLAASGAQLLRASATLSAGSCGTFGSFTQVGSNDPSTPYTDNTAGGIASGNCYRYQYLVPDNVGNVATYTSGDVKVDTTAPAFTVTTTGGAYWNGTQFYFDSAVADSFTITAVDPESGVASTSFAAAPTSWSRALGTNSATYTRTGTTTSTLASSTANNNASGTGTFASTPITVDTTNPTNSITLGSGTNAFLDTTVAPVKLYYRGNVAGSFTLVDTVTDGGSGPGSATFPVIGTTGWAFNGGVAQTVSTPIGGPSFTSGAYSWTASPSNPANKNVTSLDNVGNLSGNTAVAFTSDTTAPTAAVTFPTAASYSPSLWGSGAIAGSASDAGADVGTVNVSIKDNTSGFCADASGAFTVASCTTNFVAATGTATWNFTEAASNLADGHSYTLTVQTIDNVGNTNSAADTATWTYDTTSASATITSPSNGVNYTSAAGSWPANPPFKGTAADATSGVGAVAMSIRRNDTNQCLNGLNANASWVTCTDAGATAKFIAVTGTTSWASANESFGQISTGLPAATTTQLTMVVRTTDAAGNVSNAAASITFGITRP